jgi:hypothetical protein
MTTTPMAEVVDFAAMSNGWTVVEIPTVSLDFQLSDLRDELEAFGDVGPVDIIYASDNGIELVDAIAHGSSEGTKVVVAISLHDIPALGALLDQSRGRFERGPRVVVITPPTGGEVLARTAPNLWSWVGGRYWPSVEPASAIDVEARLTSFRDQFRISDDDVVQMVKAGTLPADPVFAEWASLLAVERNHGE